ncbi:SWEET family sugar transporter [Sphingomonas sp. STIS6.2]|uniref:SWEET family sugar transporter n=1 Tax=Sphingomonas sp. STIS6.2 TaxID=1379700 RepID=UPI001F38A6AA|nr:SWEET family sugar transporter [Sphingomonas sp. STIS6.2]
MSESHQTLQPDTTTEVDALRRSTIMIGWVATAASVSMYIAYIDQISRNLDGLKGSTIQPAAAFVAATLWTLYGALRAKWDLPLVWANVPGIFLAAAAFITAL